MSDLLVADTPDAVLTLGDNQYENGELSNFRTAYDPTWGRVKSITRPTPGNHEYQSTGAAGYYDYFGSAAGGRGEGYYSYNLGNWHVVALNSEIDSAAGSAQERWLRADLAGTNARCTIAYLHQPRFSSGLHGDSTSVRPLWQALYDANADVVLAGHDHDYERFAPMSPSGSADSARGLRSFVVGTGGKDLRGFGVTKPNSERRDSSSPGVLRMTLRADGYDWRFQPAAGFTFTDTGTGTCH